MKFRASSLGKLMVEPKAKTETLSQTAKSYIKQLAKEHYFGYTSEIGSKYFEKGNIVELESIELYNDVFFTQYEKNTRRVDNELLTGECDIYTKEMIIDIKSSWSLDTFPLLPEEADAKDYIWQVRAYMWLYDVPKAEIAYCLVDTPQDAVNIGWENPQVHEVSHIEPRKRITIIKVERDTEIEAKIEAKLIEAKKYYQEYFAKLEQK